MLSMVNDRYLELKKIVLVVQKNAKIDNFELRIDLGKTTINPPTKLPDAGTYYVRGNVVYEDLVLRKPAYVIRNLAIERIVGLEFILRSDNYKIVDNGWKILDEKLHESPEGRTVSVVAEKPLTLAQ